MHMYQGKGRWGFTCRHASFDLASPELRVPDFEVRSVHESTTFSNQLHHYGAFLDFPTRRHAITLTLILVCFSSIWFKLSNNQAKLSKHSITADTAIRIVLLTLQGCTTFTLMSSLPACDLATVQEVTARMLTTTFTS